MKIGFVGLGAMGKPMAKRLLASSSQLTVFDRSREAVEEVVELGAKAVASPAEVAANSDVTLMSLPNSAIVTEVVAGENGLLAGAAAGHTIIDLSSVDPGCSRRLADRCRELQVEYVDAPVSGGVSGAEKGTLTIMAGGTEEAIAGLSGILAVLGGNIVHVGDVGAGDAVKIVNNLLLGANMAALAEAMVLGKKLGLDSEVMAGIIGSGSGRSYVSEAKLEKFILAGSFEPGFAIDLQHKDLGLALDAARDVGMPLPMTGLAAQLFETARAKGLGKQDMSAVIKIWEDLMAVEVRK